MAPSLTVGRPADAAAADKDASVQTANVLYLPATSRDRTAVSDRTCHSLHDAFWGRALPNQINYSRDPAHNFVRID